MKTQNIATYMKRDFLEWLSRYAAKEVSDDFELLPCDRDASEFLASCEAGTQQFKSTIWGEIHTVEDKKISSFTQHDKKFICIYTNTNNLTDADLENMCGINISGIKFLQKIRFVVDGDIPPISIIPSQFLEGDVFEEDINTLLPNIFSFSVDTKESVFVSYVRGILYCQGHANISGEFINKIIELSLLIPDKNHDWLFYQMMETISSKTKKSFYLGLYKFIEFFFPISSIQELKNSLKYEGSVISLLSNCRDSLNWNMNHQAGLRKISKYATISFAEIFKETTFSFDGTNTKETLLKEDRIKSDSLEDMANIRHKLTHQGFRREEVEAKKINLAINAALEFLIGAFREYKEICG